MGRAIRDRWASGRPKVILRRAPDYDPAAIEKIIREGLAELKLTGLASGRITIKPNVVMSHPFEISNGANHLTQHGRHLGLVLMSDPPRVFRLDLIYDAYICLFFSWLRRAARGRL